MPDDPESSAALPKQYECRVRNRRRVGKLETVTIQAKDMEDVITKLHRDGYIVVSAQTSSAQHQEKSPKLFGKQFRLLSQKSTLPGGGRERKLAPAGAERKKKDAGFQIFPKVSVRELISFAIQLSALLKGGVPLLKSLQIVQKGTQNRYFKSVFDDCIQNVSGGFALSYAISEFPKVFPPVWVNLIEVGETGGNLPEVLQEIAQYQESAARVKGKVVSALFYPSILMTFATGAVSFLLLKIIPTFEGMFKGANLKLPMITQVVIAISRILRNYFPVLLILVIGVIIGVVLANRTKQGRFIFDSIKLNVPVLKSLLLQVSIVRFTRGLGMMLKSGVPILQALEIAGRLVENSMIEAALAEVREAVRGGRSMGAQLESQGLFPIFMTQLISVGEETGELDQFLKLVGTYYEERLDSFLARLATLIEPLLLVTVGSVIGVIVVSMFLPIVEISTGGTLG